MTLHLVEIVPTTPERAVASALIDQVGTTATTVGGDLIEAQVTADISRVFIVVEHDDAQVLGKAFAAADITVETIDPVRLVGAELAEVKAARIPGGTYLVEWDLPEGLTMDAYLERKKASAPLYEKVPETTFLRTYVREDMAKCLCFYDGDDEDAVRHAREVVAAPVDRFHRLDR